MCCFDADDADALQNLASHPRDTHLTAFFKANRRYEQRDSYFTVTSRLSSLGIVVREETLTVDQFSCLQRCLYCLSASSPLASFLSLLCSILPSHPRMASLSDWPDQESASDSSSPLSPNLIGSGIGCVCEDG